MGWRLHILCTYICPPSNKMEKLRLTRQLQSVLTLLLFGTIVIKHVNSAAEEPCYSNIYCYGRLLHTVQMSKIYADQKTFVDQPLRFSPAEVHSNFTAFMRYHSFHPGKEDVRAFVDANFHPNGHELDAWIPIDWKKKPEFLGRIRDPKLQAWASQLHGIWKELGRVVRPDVKKNPDRHSLLYVSHPFIVPGGRFREYYYWDSYWIQIGLLRSEMRSTVKGMLSNFLELVEQQGYVPNGGRIYYKRSQPPLLVPMMKSYLDATGDVGFIRDSLSTLEKEFNFWMSQRLTRVEVKGKTYYLARYNSEKIGPRPEAYSVDYLLASKCKTNGERKELYFNLHSAAESGWDFSSRWFLAPGNQSGSRLDTKTRHILPVDLNGFLYLNAVLLAEFYELVPRGDNSAVEKYRSAATNLRAAIRAVFWDEELGSWFDYDFLNHRRLTEFNLATIVPFWARVDESPETARRVLKYLVSVKVFGFPGGLPTSLATTGEQWDFPNGWAPLQYLMIEALNMIPDSDLAADLAFKLAEKWVLSNYKAYYESNPHAMFEKYNVTVVGLPGGGGEYGVVVGFGWSNGVVIELLNRYGDRLFVPTHRKHGTLQKLLEIANNFPFTLISL